MSRVCLNCHFVYEGDGHVCYRPRKVEMGNPAYPGGFAVTDDAPAVGNINSQEKGSGARFNNGKAPVQTIPVWIIAEAEGARPACNDNEAWRVLHALGQWQRGKLEMQSVLAEFSIDVWEDCARVFDHVTNRPVKPYPMWNWAKGMPWSVPTACAVRHLLAILRGEVNDPETGLPHRGHVACNLVMLAQYEVSWKEGDDRPAFINAA